MAFNGGSAGSLQRSGFRENPINFSTSVARWVRDSIFRTNRRSRGEMWLKERQTDRHDDYSNPPAHARRGLIRWHDHSLPRQLSYRGNSASLAQITYTKQDKTTKSPQPKYHTTWSTGELRRLQVIIHEMLRKTKQHNTTCQKQSKKH